MRWHGSLAAGCVITPHDSFTGWAYSRRICDARDRRMSMSSAEPDRHVPARPLRRLTLELFGVIAIKIAALTLIWWVVFAPQPKPDVSASAIARRLAPTSHAALEAHP